MKTQGFFIQQDNEKIARIDYRTNQLKTLKVPGLTKVTSGSGFSYCETLAGRFFISGGYASGEGTLHELVSMSKMEIRQPMINARDSHCMTAIGGECLFVTGGVKSESEVMSECEIYEAKINKWKKVASMNEARACHAAVEIKEGLLYVFCGQGAGNKFLSSIERYTEKTNSWDIIKTDVKVPGRTYPGAVGIKGGD